MRKTLIVTCALLVSAVVAYADEANQAPTDPKARSSYAVGAELGKNMQRQGVELDLDQFIKGFKTAFTGGTLEMTDEQIRETMMAFQKEAMARQQARMKELGEKNKTEGEAFLAANKGKEGVVTLPSGLQYKVIQEGTGKSPADNDKVKVHYRGTLVDGTEFDSSYARNQPAEFPVTGVIKGWTEALKLMKEGAKWQLFIPANLAYGERGGGSKIGPNAVLLFDVELLEVEPPQQANTPKPAPAPTEK